MSDQREQDFFADGMSEELLNRLARTQGLRVAARTSSFAFRDQELDVRAIGEQLGVQTILEGSVRKSGERLRITAQLIDVETGYHLWSDAFDREIEDVFVIQDQIALAIVQALSPHFALEALPSEGAYNLAAWEAWREGFQLLEKRTRRR